MREVDVRTDDGRVLHAYDVGPTGRPDELVVCWHHGTPNTGAPPEPLSAMTVPAMEALAPIQPRASRPLPLIPARLLINWASTASPSSATPVAGPVPWRVEP